MRWTDTECAVVYGSLQSGTFAYLAGGEHSIGSHELPSALGSEGKLRVVEL
jgi:hypothetical protein